MIDDPFDSGFELFVLEGGPVGSRWLLTRARLTLGRHDPLDEPQPNVLAFPEPTVSRVHAVLEWDRRRFRYVLSHRSRTNPTLVNGEIIQSVPLEPGDKIQMGQLVVEVRRIDARQAALVDFSEPAVPVETEVYLVVVHGPSRGEICPLNYSRMEVHAPLDEPKLKPGLYVQGLADYRLCLVQRDGGLCIEAPDGPRPTLLQPLSGMVYERRIGVHERPRFPREALLVCGDVAFVQVGVERAGVLAELLRRGEAESSDIHPLYAGARFGAEPLWGGEEVHALRLLSGTARNSMLWMRPEALEGPVIVGPEGADPRPHMVILDPNAPVVSVRFEGGRFVARNESSYANFNHNWDAIAKGSESCLVSGDRMTLGRRMVAYEHVPSQTAIEGLALRHGTREMPLIRAINRVGYTPDNELRINDRRLGATHGTVLFRDGAFYYQHEHLPFPMVVGDRSVAAGEEVQIREGDHLVLADGVDVDVVRRSSTSRPSDPVLIGPTQAQIEADRQRRLKAEAVRDTVEFPMTTPAAGSATTPPAEETDASAGTVSSASGEGASEASEPTPTDEVESETPSAAEESAPTCADAAVASAVVEEPAPAPADAAVVSAVVEEPAPAPVDAADVSAVVEEPAPAPVDAAVVSAVVEEPAPAPVDAADVCTAAEESAPPDVNATDVSAVFEDSALAPVDGPEAPAAPGPCEVEAIRGTVTPPAGALEPRARRVAPGRDMLEAELEIVLAEMVAEEAAVTPAGSPSEETDVSKHE